MKINLKKAAVCLVSMVLAFSAYGQNKKIIGDAYDYVGKEFALSLPQLTGMQNIYADAHIGKIFPTAIPHFAGGIDVSAVRVDTSGIADVLSELGVSADGVGNQMFLPSAAVDFRLGGVILPFDVGFMFLKTPDISFKDVSFGFTTFGADIRYAILERDLVLPCVSVGFGYLYNGVNFSYDSKSVKTKFDFSSHSLYATAQISKKFIFVTPFAGLRLMTSTSSLDWDWSISVAGGDSGSWSSGGDSGSWSSDGFDFGNIQTQLFGGVGFDFLVFQLTGSVMADMTHLNDKKFLSGCLSIRAGL